jgi:hypothetical protein
MDRNENFDKDHGKDFIRIPRETMEYMRDVSNMSRNQGAMEEHMRVQPTNLGDVLSLKQHLMTSHEMYSHQVDHYDESSHSQIPSIENRSRNWSGDTVPALDHTDLRNLHNHEHTAGEFASEYPHTTVGNSHFHH